MFEEKPQAEIEALMKRDSEFRQLYQMHKKLDKKVMDAELGVLPIDAATLAQMKREKLAAKEKLLKMYADSTNA
ncbi:MAG: YdcH family protein [Xanthomonadaceae bacterium]|nr:YdcH family protein [Xanthomonadaceae bacterium]